MKLYSTAFLDNQSLLPRYAAGALGGKTSDDINPPFGWSDVPEGTQSFVFICHDPDAPAIKTDVNKTDREVAPETPRHTFYHWLLVDLPAHLRSIEEGEYSRGFVTHGKQDKKLPNGARQGLNDYTLWSKGNPDMTGLYFGYDGPWPPFNDSIPHRYLFTLYALAIKNVDIKEEFTGADLMNVLADLKQKNLILAQTTLTGLYSLNPRLTSK